MIDIAARLERAYHVHADRPAACIAEAHHTYAQLYARVLAIHGMLQSVTPVHERFIGVWLGDDLETYAAILAVLRSGRAFVPLNPAHPVERNASIMSQAGLGTLLAASPHAIADIESPNMCVLRCAEATGGTTPDVVSVQADDVAYLLFTSGSTGEPKGVPISHGNLSAFLDGLAAAGCEMDADDRVLQMFDLTFDFSIATYLAPLSKGACIYPITPGTVKFAEVYRLLDEHRLTVAPMVPSVLTYLRPYFGDVDLPALRLSFFCGEALLADVADEWLGCARESALVNFYGPTEATVFAMYYDWRPEHRRDKTLNGVVSIGRPMASVESVVVDEELLPLPVGERGELCLAGAQVTPGYWHDEDRNSRSFFTTTIDGRSIRFYRTGDLAMKDADGDYLFCGRVDHQVKLQGYRVELGEIEHHVHELLPGRACVVVPYTNPQGAMELRLVVEGEVTELKPVLAALRERIPSYMVPARGTTVPQLPLNANGKVDRRALQRGIEGQHG